MNEQLGYGYDASHNLAARTNHTLLQTFTSDSRNQLSTIIRSGTLTVAGSVTGAVATLGVNGTWAEIYSDQTFATTNGLTLQDGNNLFVTAGSNASGTLVLSTKEARTLPVTVGFSYDLNGNLLSDGLKGYEYDDANQLVRVTVTNGWKAEFAYDGLGRRRVAKDYSWSGASWTLTNEVRYVWDGMVVLQERDGANAVQVTYTRGLDLSGTRQGAGGIGGLLARADANGTAFYHSDAGGNITAMTDGNGNAVARYLYDPFGNLLAKSGSMADANHYRFSSKEAHPNSGLYYYGYRYYEPNLQRWLNEDPIGEAGGLNLYGFVENDPIDWFDNDGLSKGLRPSGSGGAITTELLEELNRPGNFVRPRSRNRVPNFEERMAENFRREIAREAMRRRGLDPDKTYIGPLSEPSSITPTRTPQAARPCPENQPLNVSQNAPPALPEGVVYLRCRPSGEYVGQAESWKRYLERQKEHADKFPFETFRFQVLQRARPGTELNKAEESWIRAGGGPKSTGGRLENRRHQMSDENYEKAGGDIPYP